MTPGRPPVVVPAPLLDQLVANPSLGTVGVAPLLEGTDVGLQPSRPHSYPPVQLTGGRGWVFNGDLPDLVANS